MSWTILYNLSSEELIVCDFDGNGRDEIIIDFGSSHGLWIFANGISWIQAHTVSPEGLTVGNVY